MDKYSLRGGLIAIGIMVGVPSAFSIIFGPAPSDEPSPTQQLRNDQQFWQQQRQENDVQVLRQAAGHTAP